MPPEKSPLKAQEPADRNPARGKRNSRGGGQDEKQELGSRINQRYRHREQDVIGVHRADLRELSTFGILQEGLGAVGMFMFSGAFWLAVTLLIEHSGELTKVVWGFMFCLVSMIFGGALMWAGYSHFKMKRDCIKEIFDGEVKDINNA